MLRNEISPRERIGCRDEGRSRKNGKSETAGRNEEVRLSRDSLRISLSKMRFGATQCRPEAPSLASLDQSVGSIDCPSRGPVVVWIHPTYEVHILEEAVSRRGRLGMRER